MAAVRRTLAAAWAILLGGLFAASVRGQTSAPGICFAFNEASGSPQLSVLPLEPGGVIYFAFTAPNASTVTQIDVGVSFPASLPSMTLEVFTATTSGMIGSLVGSSTAPGAFPFHVFPLSTAIAFASGGTYALRLSAPAGTPQPTFIQGLATPTAALQYAMLCGPVPTGMFPPCSTYAAVGTFGPRIRFRAPACGPTPLASALYAGAPCGAGSTTFPALAYSGLPVLGTTVTFSIVGSSGLNTLYWGVGPATAGVALGSGCLLYIDPASLQSLATAGFEPLASSPTTGFPTYLPVPIPFLPSIAGAVITVQAALTGVISGASIGGYVVQLTGAAQLTLGY